MKILKKYTEGGTPKAKSKGLTDREVWESNKDGVQQKYSSFEDYQKAAQEWRNRNDKKMEEPTTRKDDKGDTTPGVTDDNEKGVSLRKAQRIERRSLRKEQRGERKHVRKSKRIMRKMKKMWEKGDWRDIGEKQNPVDNPETPSGFAGMIAKAAAAGGKDNVHVNSKLMETGGVSPKKESKRSWVGKLVDRTKKKYNRFVQKRKEKPMSEKEFYEPNVAKGGGSGYKSMTEHGNLGRGISALMTKKTLNPDSWTAEDEAKLKRMQRIQAANKSGSKESVRDIYLEETKSKQDKSKKEYDKTTAQWKKEDEEAKKKRKEGSEKIKQKTTTPMIGKMKKGGITVNKYGLGGVPAKEGQTPPEGTTVYNSFEEAEAAGSKWQKTGLSNLGSGGSATQNNSPELFQPKTFWWIDADGKYHMETFSAPGDPKTKEFIEMNKESMRKHSSKRYTKSSPNSDAENETDNETVNNENPPEVQTKQEGKGNYRGGSDTPQVIRDKNIIRNRNKNNESSNADEVTTSSNANKTNSGDRVERRSNRKEHRRDMRKYRQEMRQYNRTMRRKAREERRENRGMTYTQGRRISPRRWWKNLRDRLGARYLHEGRAKGYRDFRTSRTTKPVKPVKNFQDGGKVQDKKTLKRVEVKKPLKQDPMITMYFSSEELATLMKGFKTGNWTKRGVEIRDKWRDLISKEKTPFEKHKEKSGVPKAKNFQDGGMSKSGKEISSKEINEFLKQNKAAKEMKRDFTDPNKVRDFNWEKIKQPKTATKNLTKKQMRRILMKKGGKQLLKRMVPMITAAEIAHLIATADKQAPTKQLKKRAKTGSYNMGRKI